VFSVDHSALLSILQSMFSVYDQPLAWFHSYLTNRTQTSITASSQALLFLFIIKIVHRVQVKV